MIPGGNQAIESTKAMQPLPARKDGVPIMKSVDPALLRNIVQSFPIASAPPGEIRAGRNDPCPCGSGKKYKKCCGNNANG